MTTPGFLRRAQFRVHRLRLHGAGADTLRARQRTERALDAALAPPAGLGPTAILCIRRLRGSWPCAPDRHQEAPRPWDRAAAAVLQRLLRGAARPALGPVPAAAEAVLFADEAELLACLAEDWCDHVLTACWWWQGLLHEVDGTSALLTAWLQAPAYIPSALGHLAVKGRLIAFVRTLSDGAVRQLFQALTHTFALPEIQAALEARSDVPGAAESAEHEAGQPGQPLPQAMGAVRSMPAGPEEAELPMPLSPSVGVPPPWNRWVPESQDASLSPAAQCFAGLGLMLQRAQAVVRARSFAEAMRQWCRAISLPPEPGRPTDEVAQEKMGPPATGRRTTVFGDGALVAGAMGADQVNPPAPTSPPLAAPNSETVAEPAPVQTPTSTAPPMSALAPSCSEISAPSCSEVAPSAQVSNEKTAPLPVPSEVLAPLPEDIETELGGLFYLINLGLFLELYGDFTSPARPGIALPLWDFITLLGRHLLGTARSEDPVWALLAGLAGRKVDDPPGKEFEPPGSWRLPPDWLLPFAEPGAWDWDAADGRLRVWHPAGFWVLDVPREPDDPGRQLERETKGYAAKTAFMLRPACFPTSVGRMANPSGEPEGLAIRPTLDHWLGWLMPYLRIRLGRALGLADFDELPNLLFVHRARVSVTATHLDITLSLAELPIAIRLAGLDRDPGWVPAAGRFIAFHFE